MTQILWNDRDVTDFTTNVTVEQNVSAAGREAVLSLIYAPEDSRFSLLNPACGESVTVVQMGETLFHGLIERAAWSSDGCAVTLICYDASSRLAKNSLYQAFSGTPAQIAARLCQLCGLVSGSLWNKAGLCWIPPACGRSAFSLLREAYGNECVVETRKDAVTVRPLGATQYVLRTDSLFSVSAANSCEGMITGVSVISGAGAVKASVRQTQLEAQYGQRRQAVSLSGSQSGAAAQARSRLTGLARSGQITIFGDPAVVCGARIQPDKGSFGLSGNYLITSVTHRIQAGIFTTTMGMVQT